MKAIVEDAPVAILLHVNEQKIHHKYVKGFQMIPAGLIDMHRGLARPGLSPAPPRRSSRPGRAPATARHQSRNQP